MKGGDIRDTCIGLFPFPLGVAGQTIFFHRFAELFIFFFMFSENNPFVALSAEQTFKKKPIAPPPPPGIQWSAPKGYSNKGGHLLVWHLTSVTSHVNREAFFLSESLVALSTFPCFLGGVRCLFVANHIWFGRKCLPT